MENELFIKEIKFDDKPMQIIIENSYFCEKHNNNLMINLCGVIPCKMSDLPKFRPEFITINYMNLKTQEEKTIKVSGKLLFINLAVEAKTTLTIVRAGIQVSENSVIQED